MPYDLDGRITKRTTNKCSALNLSHRFCVSDGQQAALYFFWNSATQNSLLHMFHYKKLHHNPTTEYNNKILKTLQHAIREEQISEEEALYISNDYPRISNFYTLPKIHKANNPG